MDLGRDCPGIFQRPGLKATGQLGPEKICWKFPLLKSRGTGKKSAGQSRY